MSPNNIFLFVSVDWIYTSQQKFSVVIKDERKSTAIVTLVPDPVEIVILDLDSSQSGCWEVHGSGTLRSVRIHGALRTFDTGIYRGDRTRIAGLAGADGSLMNRERLRR